MVQLDYLPATPTQTTGNLTQVTATTSGAAHTLHTSTTETQNEWDSVYVDACNNHTEEVEVTVEWGGTGAANTVVVNIPAKVGFVVLIPNHRLRDGQTVKVFADVASVVNVYTDVERIRRTDET